MVNAPLDLEALLAEASSWERLAERRHRLCFARPS
jgi:hypothetical protein